MNKLQQWFHDHIGKKVVAEHPTDGKQTVTVKNKKHADHLYGSQQTRSVSYSTQLRDHDDCASNLLSNILLYEMITSDNNYAPDDNGNSGSSFDGFGGGSTDGAGAGGSWSDSGSSSYDSGSSSYDSGSSSYYSGSSSDSTSSFDSSSSFDSGGSW